MIDAAATQPAPIATTAAVTPTAAPAQPPRVASPSFPSVVRTIRRSLPSDVSLIVDLGAGLGGASAWLAEETDAAVVAVQPEQTGRNAPRRPFPGLTVVSGQVSAVPLPSACADVVVALDVVTSMTDLAPMLVETRRLLRHGGVVAIADLFLPPAPASGTDHRDVTDATHTFRSHRRVIAAMQAVGFQAVELDATAAPLPGRWRRLTGAIDDRVSMARTPRELVLRRLARGHLDRHLARAIREHHLIGGCVVATLNPV